MHDYQLALVPGMVRRARPDLRVSHFTHTPFCGPNSIRVLPDRRGRGALLVDGLGAVGVPHRAVGTRVLASAARGARARPDVAAVRRRRSDPIPTRWPRCADSPATAAAAAELDELVGDRKLVLRTDRIDLSKNIVRGFLVYDELLATHPEWRERVVFVAMLNRSRESLAEYQAYEQEVDQIAAARERAVGAPTAWQPVVVDTRDDYEQTVAGFDPLRRAAREPGEGRAEPRRQGRPARSTSATAWCCSHPEAGAYDELAEAVLPIHPYDIEQSARGAAPRAVDARRRARVAARTPARAGRGAHAPDLVARAPQPRALSSSASASSTTASPSGPSTTTSASRISGRALVGRHADASPRARARRSRRARAARRTRRGRRRRRPRSRPPTRRRAHELGDRACPCRPAPAAAAPPPSGPRSGASRSERAPRSPPPTPSPRRPDRAGARQWMVTATSTLALDQQARQRGVGVVGGPRRRPRPTGARASSTTTSPSTSRSSP